MEILVTSGVGEGPTPLAAFDAALMAAGVGNYNLLHLSSIIPPSAVVRCGRFVPPMDDYGHRFYVVMAQQGADQPDDEAWAGLGWVQEQGDGRGLFVELTGGTRKEVAQAIDMTLEAMMNSRGAAYGTVERQLAGIRCLGQPVCAVVVAIYESQGWSNGQSELVR